MELFEPSRKADVDRFLAGEAPSEIIKKNDARTVLRVSAGRPALFVKRFVRDRARTETRMLQALARARIPCPRLVATGRDDQGSFVITEEVENAELLQSVLEKGGPGIRPLLDTLAEVTRRMHIAGFDHLDLHVGNLLARDGELFVLDAHRARVSRYLSSARRRKGTAFLVFSFPKAVPLTEIVRFLKKYGWTAPHDIREVFHEIRNRQQEHLKSRLKRCTRDSSGFGVRDGVYYRKSADPSEVMDWIRDSRREVIKEGGGESLSHSNGRFLKKTKSARALRIWKNAHALRILGIGTPRLDACGDGWVVGEWLDALHVYEWVKARYADLDRGAQNDFLFRFARAVRRMHANGVTHRDLKAANILVTDDGFQFVDLDRVKFSVEVSDKDRIFNLAQINASIIPPVSRTDRMRFFRWYVGRDHRVAKSRRRWIRDIMRITIERKHYWPPR